MASLPESISPSWLLAALSGVMMALAVPPVDLYFLGWIGLVPLFLALQAPRRGGFGEGLIAGVVYNGGTLYWLALNNGTDWYVAAATMIATVAILASSWGIASWVFCRFKDRVGELAWLVIPFSWTAWEGWLGSLPDIAFPWPLLALTQSKFESVLQVMEFTGVWGVSFWVAAVNVVVLLVWKGTTKQARRIGFVGFVVLVLLPPVAIIHAVTHYRPGQPTARVLVVQGNIPPDEKWVRGADFSIETYDSLTRAGSTSIVDLAIWPETAVPVNLLRQSGYRESLTRLASESRLAILTGASDQVRIGSEPRPLNSAQLIDPFRGVTDRYGKIDLVPFGERVPFQKLFPALGKLNFGQAEFLVGPRHTLFERNTSEGETLRFPALICFESAFPDLTRQFVLRGANFLTTISNDAWYGRSSEPAQINALSRFRCIETRRAMARASNSGISMICDQLGREIISIDLFKRGQSAAIVPICEETTFYVRHGDAFLGIVTTIFGMMLLAAFFRRPRV